MPENGQVAPDPGEQIRLAKLADQLGFGPLMIHDVPLNSADYSDPVGHLDPRVLLGAVAANTERIGLLSGAVVLPLRHPLHVAKGAVSVSALSRGRFVLGLGTGPSCRVRRVGPEYRGTAAAPCASLGATGRSSRPSLPRHCRRGAAECAGVSSAAAVARTGSAAGCRFWELSLEWIARHAIGWMTYHREPAALSDRHRPWRAAVARAAPGEFRTFAVGMHLELCANGHATPSTIPGGHRTGYRGLIERLSGMRAAGVEHIALNLMPTSRKPQEVLRELADRVLPCLRAERQTDRREWYCGIYCTNVDYTSTLIFTSRQE